MSPWEKFWDILKWVGFFESIYADKLAQFNFFYFFFADDGKDDEENESTNIQNDEECQENGEEKENDLKNSIKSE